MSLRGYLCTPYVCVVKGSPVHRASVSLRGYLRTPYVCVVKVLPVHHTSVLLRPGYLCTPYVHNRLKAFTLHMLHYRNTRMKPKF